MALIQFSSVSPTSIRSSPSFPCSPPHPITSSTSATKDLIYSTSSSSSTYKLSSLRRDGFSVNVKRNSTRVLTAVTVRSSLDTVGPTATVGQVTEVTKDTFWPIVKSAGEKAVVLDMYTQWCGPCKVIAPKFIELSKKYDDVVFLKLDCNQDNKSLAKELGIRVVPTFKILKDNKIVKEVTGAKLDDLILAIEAVRSG